MYSTELLATHARLHDLGNTLTIPANAETSRVDGSRWGGVLGYWEGEAQQLTGTRPKFRNLNCRLKKLTVLTFVTNELLTDSATALEQYLGRVAPTKSSSRPSTDDQRDGARESRSDIRTIRLLIQVAHDTDQAAETITYTNVMNMYNQLWVSAAGTHRLAVQPGNRAAALADGAAGRNRRSTGIPAL